MKSEDSSSTVRRLTSRVCIVIDVVLALVFLGKGWFYAQQSGMRATGYANHFLATHVVIAAAFGLAALLLGRKTRGSVVFQVVMFALVFVVVTVTNFFNPASTP